MENKEKIGFLKRLSIVMTKPKEYHKIAKQSAGKSIGMYFIMAILYTIVLVAILFFFYQTLLNMAKDYIDKLPEFSISKNGFISQMEQPINFYDNTIGSLIYIDSNITLEEIRNINVDKIYGSNAYVLIGTDAFSVKSAEDIINMTFLELFGNEEMNNSSNEYLQETEKDVNTITGEQPIEENDYEVMPNINIEDNKQEYEFNNQTIQEVFSVIETSKLPIIIFVISALVILLYMFISFLIMGLIYSLIVWIICLIYKKKLSFKEIYNISMYSNVTATILSLLMLFVNFGYWSIIRLVIVIIYMQIAIKNYEETKKENVTQDKNN
ncbi:MAG: DUF1189 domain-containing protein [Clostridiales bacterium]|nr:DUF1189 domain-containing protein [Clostridiales bacterium]